MPLFTEMKREQICEARIMGTFIFKFTINPGAMLLKWSSAVHPVQPKLPVPAAEQTPWSLSVAISSPMGYSCEL